MGEAYIRVATLYGSARIGIKQFQNNWENYLEIEEIPSNMAVDAVSYALETAKGDRGNKVFELSNHLGNVLATVSDKKLGRVLDSTSLFAAYYEGQVQSAQDYYAFGWNIPSRKFNTGSYRHGFNGKENDSDFGEQLIQDYGFRIYNPLIAKFLSVDPLTSEFPWNSAYAFAEGSSIVNIDLDGLEKLHYNVIINRKTGQTSISFSHSEDIIEQDLIFTRKPTQWLDPGEYQYRTVVNRRQEYVLHYYDPSYGRKRRGTTKSTGERMKEFRAEYSGPLSHEKSGSGYAHAYGGFDAYDLGAMQQGKDELSNTEKDAIDQGTAEALLGVFGMSLGKGKAGKTGRVGTTTTITKSEWEKLLQETGHNMVTVYHKGELDKGLVKSGKSFSTGTNRASVSALDRDGTVHEFNIPRDVFEKWEGKGQLQKLNDYDYKTGVYNEEVRFSGEISKELNQYKKNGG